jgi:hypothetical protein
MDHGIAIGSKCTAVSWVCQRHESNGKVSLADCRAGLASIRRIPHLSVRYGNRESRRLSRASAVKQSLPCLHDDLTRIERRIAAIGKGLHGSIVELNGHLVAACFAVPLTNGSTDCSAAGRSEERALPDLAHQEMLQ